VQSVEVRVTAQRCFLARLFSLTQRYEFTICFDFLCVRVRVLAVVLARCGPQKFYLDCTPPRSATFPTRKRSCGLRFRINMLQTASAANFFSAA